MEAKMNKVYNKSGGDCLLLGSLNLNDMTGVLAPLHSAALILSRVKGAWHLDVVKRRNL